MIGRLFRRYQLQDPPWYQFIFSNLALAPVWTLARLYIGWQWLQSGWGKVTGDGWIDGGGVALQRFWERIVAVPEQGSPPIRYGWYRDFIEYMLDHGWYEWFAWVIAFGEVTAGLALILGAFTALAALGGAFMNFNFMLAGSASANPVLFAISILLVLAWKTAGQIGLDRWLLPALGTPWQAGHVFHPNEDIAAGRRVPEPAD